MKKLFEDFKKFAFKGNVLDMAVGVIIGGAFGKIVTSLVNDILMPFIGLLIGKIAFSELKWVFQPAVMDGSTVVKAESALLYGNFIQNIVDFLLIAISIFVFVRIINNLRTRFKKKEEEKPSEPPKPTEAELLTEIRDLLRAQAGNQDKPAEAKDR